MDSQSGVKNTLKDQKGKNETRRERPKSALKKRKVFKIVKRGPFRLFENPVCCKISKKMKETLWRYSKNTKFLLKKFLKKKTKNENFETVS